MSLRSSKQELIKEIVSEIVANSCTQTFSIYKNYFQFKLQSETICANFKFISLLYKKNIEKMYYHNTWSEVKKRLHNIFCFKK